MNTISASGHIEFDSETFALLEAVADGIEISEFDADLDVAFGTPLDLYEAGELPHERLAGLDEDEALDAIRARHDRLLAAADIAADDPAIAVGVRHRLVDALLPYVAQMRIAPRVDTALPVAV